MNIYKKIILVSFFGGLGIGAVIVVALYILIDSRMERINSYAVEGVELRTHIPNSTEELNRRDATYSFPYTPCYNLLVSNHVTYNGKKVVLKWTRDDAGDWAAVDDETFEKLSIEISELNIGNYELPAEKVNIFYSRGASAWVHQCSGSYGNEAEGNIDIKEINDEYILADISIKVNAISAHDLSTDREVKLEYSGKFNKDKKYYSTEFE